MISTFVRCCCWTAFRSGAVISPEAVKELKGLKLIEGRSPNFFVSCQGGGMDEPKGALHSHSWLGRQVLPAARLGVPGQIQARLPQATWMDLLTPKLPEVLDAATETAQDQEPPAGHAGGKG
jgi:hypothetical protein